MYVRLFYAASLFRKSFRNAQEISEGGRLRRVDFASSVVEFCVFLNFLALVPLLRLLGLYERVQGAGMWIFCGFLVLTWLYSYLMFLRKRRGSIKLLERLDLRYRHVRFPAVRIVWTYVSACVLLPVVLAVCAGIFR